MSDLDGSAVASLRRLNGSKVLSVLRTEAYRKFTVREMSIATGLSRPTVGRLLDDLVDLGWGLSAEGKPGATGRPARRYWFNRFRGVIVSLDVGRSGVAIMIADLVGSELAWEIELGQDFTSVDEVMEFTLPRLEKHLASVRKSLGLEDCDLSVLAVSLAAPVLADADGVHIDTLTVVDGWRGQSFIPALRERFGSVPLLVNNDMLLMAEAELHLGALAGAQQALFCILAGVSIVVLVHNGKVHAGSFHLAGDIGSLAEYDWVAKTRQAIEDSGYGEQGSAQLMVDAAHNGEPAAIAAVRTLGEGLARGITDVAAMWDPEIIVVDGQLATLGALFLNPIEASLRELGQDDYELTMTEVPDDKGTALGGIIKALDAIDWTV